MSGRVFEATKPVDADPIRVITLSWSTSKPQVWLDDWRQVDRICRFQGKRVVCNRRTYAFDDGQNDPRGVLGDRAASALDPEEYDGWSGPVVPACFSCMNDEHTYSTAVRIAQREFWAASS